MTAYYSNDSLSAAAAVVANVTESASPDLLTTVESVVESTSNYNLTEVIIIGTIAAILSLITVVGNIMVMISFKIDKQLQIISNYFLFSLAIADFAIGLISMPLFTVYTLLGRWPLGATVCDTWLALDYLASNASVLNLLIISFDRYFSVTRPLTYRAKRTTKKVAIMIGCAWGISLLLWPPWIYAWPYIEGDRTVPDGQCYIQFIETNQYITFGTAIAAFYVPVTIMCALYWRIWRETEKRKKDLPNLQAGKKDSSKRSNSSDEQNNACSTVDLEEWRRPRSESSTGADNDSVYMHSSVCVDTHTRRPASAYPRRGTGPLSRLHRVRAWCVAWWHSGREDSDTEEESPSEQGQGCITPVSLDTPLQSSVSRDPYSTGSLTQQQQTQSTNLSNLSSAYPAPAHHQLHHPLHHPHHHHTPTRLTPNASRESRSLPRASTVSSPHAQQPGGGGARSASTDSVYTILIRLPDGPRGEGIESTGGRLTVAGADDVPSIRMIPEDDCGPTPVAVIVGQRAPIRDDFGGGGMNHQLNRRPSAMPDIRIPLNAKIIPKQLAGGKTMLANATKNQGKKKKKTQEKKADKKAAKTLSAILLTFILTWTPYNVLVLLKPLTSSSTLIPDQLWDFFYALCYINSTINPMCYALCNASFRRTYLRILKCKWHSRQRTAMNRGFYN